PRGNRTGSSSGEKIAHSSSETALSHIQESPSPPDSDTYRLARLAVSSPMADAISPEQSPAPDRSSPSSPDSTSPPLSPCPSDPSLPLPLVFPSRDPNRDEALLTLESPSNH